MRLKTSGLIAGAVTILFLSGCPSVDSGSGGGGGNVVGGAGDPPGVTGDTAATLKENPLSAICQDLNGSFYVASNGGKPLVSSDGATFTVLEGTKMDLSSVACDQNSTVDTNVWFAGAGGTILFYDGSALSSQTSGTTEDLHSIFETNTSNVFATGNKGVIAHFDGSNWTAQTVDSTLTVNGVGGPLTGASTFAAATKRKMFKFNTPSWTSEDLSATDVPDDTHLNAVYGDTDSGELFVVGDAGTILHRSQAGVWAAQTSGTSLDLFAVHGTSNGNVFAVGEDAVILKYNGSTWSKQTNPADGLVLLKGVWVLSSTSAYAVGAETTASDATGIILKFDGTSWTQIL